MVYECISVIQCLHVYMNYTNKNLLSKSKAFQCNIRGQHGSRIWELHPDVCWVFSLLTWEKRLHYIYNNKACKNPFLVSL